MKNVILAVFAVVGAVSAFAESRSSTILATSAEGSSAAITMTSESARTALSEASASTDASSQASFSQGQAGRGLDIIGYGISDSAVTIAVGVKEAASQSGNTIGKSASDSTALAGDYASASGQAVSNFSKQNVFPVSKALYNAGKGSVNALVSASNATVKFAVDASGAVYTFSRDNVVQPVWGLSVAFSTVTWQSATESVNVVVSGESAQSVSGSVRDASTTLWEVLVSASGEVSASTTEFSEAPSQSIGRLLDDASKAVTFVVSNPGVILSGASDAILVSVESTSASGRNLASAAGRDMSTIGVSLETYSTAVSAVSLSRADKKGKKARVDTVFFNNPAKENHSRLYYR